LLREPPATLVSAIIDTDIAPLRPDVSLPAITSHLATYNLVAAPVVDDDDRLLGAVTVDDVLDHLLPDGWRDTDPSTETTAEPTPEPTPEPTQGVPNGAP
ncbi:MAG TPA: CBS domain-containing protein, partial [Acidothermaceae bacterium]